MVRILCVQSLTDEEQEVSLAKKSESGEWIMQGDIALRSPFIGPWMPAKPGTTHILEKKADAWLPLGSFEIPAGVRRTILILMPDATGKAYRVQTIDPAKLNFRKGKALIVNYSRLPAVVMLGKKSTKIAPGKQVVQDIVADEGGMYRLLIGHLGEGNRIIPCYDRYVSSREGTRKFILLFPDPDTGLRAMSLSEFGPFE